LNEVDRKLANSQLKKQRPRSADTNQARSTQYENLQNKFDIVFRSSMAKFEECGNRLVRKWSKDLKPQPQQNYFYNTKDTPQYDHK